MDTPSGLPISRVWLHRPGDLADGRMVYPGRTPAELAAFFQTVAAADAALALPYLGVWGGSRLNPAALHRTLTRVERAKRKLHTEPSGTIRESEWGVPDEHPTLVPLASSRDEPESGTA